MNKQKFYKKGVLRRFTAFGVGVAFVYLQVAMPFWSAASAQAAVGPDGQIKDAVVGQSPGSQVAAPSADPNRILSDISDDAKDAADSIPPIKLAQGEGTATDVKRPIFVPRALPAEPKSDHSVNKTLNMGPFKLNSLINVSMLHPMKLEASYNEPITLKDALIYALHNNLPIKISRESWNYQKYQLVGNIIAALPVPNLSMGLSQTWSNVLTTDTTSNALVFQTLIRYPVFQGGSQMYGMLAQYYREKGWRQAFNANVNDVLLDVYQKYNNLVLQHALLQIRAKSLEVSEAQLKLNDSLYVSGTGTQFAIMQSRTQWASDRQALLQQQIAVRQAALLLAYSLNLPMAVNLVPQEGVISEQSLIDEHAAVNALLDVALSHRPEVRQYELFRLSAQRNVQTAAASLYPSISFFTAYTHSQASVSPANGNVSGIAVAQIASTGNGLGTASNNALGQTASFSPTGSTTANSGVNNTINTPIVAGSGGLPLNLVQSGSLVTSGAVAPSIAGGNSGINGATGATNLNGSGTSSFGVFPGSVNTYQAGFTMSWSLSDMGLQNVVNIISARALSRQALLQANQQLLLVGEQVRSAYLASLTARDQIDSVAYGVASTREALRLADLRLRSGMGSNVELIAAQRDYVNSLAAQAQAIVSSNLAQAQLLHDMGVISVESLTDGYRPEPSNLKNKKKRGTT